MESKEFIVKPEERVNSSRLWMRELREDISVIPERDRPLIQDRLDRIKLVGKQQSRAEAAINEWWRNKYGFPFHMIAAREETLVRKYAPAPELKQRLEFQERIFSALAEGNETTIAETKKEYEEKYPDQLEGVTVVIELGSFFENQKYLESCGVSSAWSTRCKKMVEETTQYRFLLSHFIKENSGDKEFLRLFWDAVDRLAQKMNALKEFHALRRATLSQNAVFKTLENIGYKPQIAHPREDAFDAVDLWTKEGAVQIKGSPKKNDLIFEETDIIGFPAVEAEVDGETRHFDTHWEQPIKKFSVKLKAYNDRYGKNMKGYFIVVPHQKFDAITGEPDAVFVQFIKSKLLGTA